MRLFITKNQAPGFIGTNFELKARVELTPDEMALVKKYKAEGVTVMEKKMKYWWSNEFTVSLTIGSLINGQTFKGKNVFELLGYEEAVKKGCKNLMSAVSVFNDFGGEEVFDFDFSDGVGVEE